MEKKEVTHTYQTSIFFLKYITIFIVGISFVFSFLISIDFFIKKIDIKLIERFINVIIKIILLSPLLGLGMLIIDFIRMKNYRMSVITTIVLGILLALIIIIR